MDAGRLAAVGAAITLAVFSAGGGIPAQAVQAGDEFAPVAPVITEPEVDGQLLSGADVHMETRIFQDADPARLHRCTDWEIWTRSPAERVWFADCLGGVQRVHTHLADGRFENSFVGRADLVADRDYELRVRHRDDSGDAGTEWSAYSTRGFRTDRDHAPLPGAPEWNVRQPGYVVEEVATGLQLPVDIAPVPGYLGDPAAPMFYVTELYGRIKVVRGDFTVGTYASGLLNFDPNGEFPGSGELGVTGVVVDPGSGDVFASMLYESGGKRYPKVVRFHSTDGGLTASSQQTVLDMPGEPQEASHQISNLSIGPDGKLYVHMGDGFSTATARDLTSLRGKILRVNLDGSAAAGNPFFDAGDGITARDYVFAYGFRNPFGGAWRTADGAHYEVENGPSVDRLVRVAAGTDYGWNGSNASMRTGALYNWDPAHAPVNIVFTEPEWFHAGCFPPSTYGHAFVSESGPTFASGPQVRGKRIVEFAVNADGSVSAPQTLVEYNGTGKSTVVGLAVAPGGLYFTSLYSDSSADPTGSQAKIFRVRYVPPQAPVTAYGDRDFTGTAQAFDTGMYDASRKQLGAVGNDRISSLVVAPGMRLVVCRHDSAGHTNVGDIGLCRYYGPGRHAYVGADLNDAISLIAVAR